VQSAEKILLSQYCIITNNNLPLRKSAERD